MIHDFCDDSDCRRCGAYGPNDADEPCRPSRAWLAERAAHLLRQSILCYRDGDNANANLYRTLFRAALLELFTCRD